MNRWWANADQARTILDRVDDSDVVQGVGTAVLGYHALATGVLKPLSEQTLVDVTTIRQALDGIDLEPVAKALGAATRPVMGDAADKYGELLAENLHQQAVDATSRFVTALTNTGVDWPSAVSRAADIHGVPLDQLGVAGEKLRGPRLAPIAQQDWADRALVGFAARVGNREADGSVSKAMKMRTREWDEDDVNRDRMGRFAPEGQSRLTVSAQEARQDFDAYRKARLERKARKDRRKSRSASRIGLEMDSAPASHPVLGAAVRAEMESEPSAKKDLKQALKDRLKAGVKERMKGRHKEALKAFLDPGAPPKGGNDGGTLMQPIKNEPRRGDGFYEGVRMRVPTERYFAVPDWVAAEIVHSGGFNVGKLTETRGIPFPVGMNAKDFQSFLNDASEMAQREPQSVVAPGRNVIIRIVGGEVAFADGADNHSRGHEAELASGGTYRVVDGDWPEYDSDGFEQGATDFTFKPNRASTMKMVKSLSVKLDNSHDFEYNDMDPAREADEYEDWEDTPPLPYDAGFRKADDWDESEVNRDRMGRFARETSRGQVIPITSDKAMRIRAYQEAKRRKAKRRAKTAQARIGLDMQQESAPLADMAREQAAPQQKASAELGREQLVNSLKDDLKKRIRQRVIERHVAARKAALEGRIRPEAALNLTGSWAVFPSDDQMATIQHIGETGGTYEETRAFQALMEGLAGRVKPGKDAVDIMDKDRPEGRQMVATPNYEDPVPVFDTAQEADAYAMQFVNTLYEAWDMQMPMTKRMSEFMAEAEKRGSYVYAMSAPHASEDGKWVPKVFYAAAPESMQTVLVGSKRDWERVSDGEVPSFVVEDPMPLMLVMASSGFDSQRVADTHDVNVQVIRMRFMDNVRH